MSLAEETIDVQRFVDERRIGFRQIRLFCLCLLILILDGYDTVVVGYVAPQLRAHWGVQPAQLGPLFGVGLLGLTVGSFVFGPIADRVGRRVTLIWSVILFGVASFASAFAPSLIALIALRFVTGLGLGGAMPNAYTLAVEYSPTRLRASLVAPIGCGLAVGGAVAGLFAAQAIQAYGWPSMFVVGGMLPLILAPVLVRWLPESVRYQIARGTPDVEVRQTMSAVFPDVSLQGVRLVCTEHAPKGFPVTQLFRGGLVSGTLLLWITAFGALLVVYFLSSWLPVLIHESGASLSTAATMTSCYLFGNTFGAILLGLLMDRCNPQLVLCAAFIAACAALVSFGNMIGAPILAYLTLFVIGVGTGGTTTGTNILAASFYPTASRATGVSWTLAFGRIGSIVGATATGLLVAAKWSISQIFVAAAFPLVLAAIAVALLGWVRRAKGNPTGNQPTSERVVAADGH
ncbi:MULTISPECIES: MFS transporter [Burkholderiaceae]|uniref:MFS transporter n=1 Tax=Burkholderiaceae TaxID=119060 RepID=UPI0014210E3A|nr:MFS transporter [Paraburkholderia sp. Ac-20342]